MRFTSRSITFLFILSMIAVFFFGFNAGKYISHVEKPVMKVATSPAPTISQSPVLKMPIITRTMVEDCHISFLLPDEFKRTNPASHEAEFRNEHESVIVQCDKKHVAARQAELIETNASTSGRIAGQKILMFSSDEASIFVVPNTKKQNVLIQMSHSLEELIKDTLQFE